MFDGRFKSKLDKYYAEILIYRHKDNLTYSNILKKLEQEYSLKVNYYTLYNFLKIREKRNIYPTDEELEEAQKLIDEREEPNIFDDYFNS